MRRIAVVPVSAAVLLAVVAPGGATTAPRGRVTGLIRLCGGPPPGRCFLQDGTAYVLGARHRVVARQETRHARFSFLLLPGEYTLVAKTGGARGQRPIVIKTRARPPTTPRPHQPLSRHPRPPTPTFRAPACGRPAAPCSEDYRGTIEVSRSAL